ncbi:MAG: molybdopterin-dependent oxidoreductase, partial [Deltaproteobacteria bacterium]|nr:molybdopterin-dependent oxidoreductase [Deltaproteobacteria bacterium]
RLTHPLRRKGERGENRWERITWDDALDEIAERFSRVKNESGSEYVAMAQGTGRPYMNLSPRFANAFGTPNYVGVGHLCYLPRWFAGSGGKELCPGLHPTLPPAGNHALGAPVGWLKIISIIPV